MRIPPVDAVKQVKSITVMVRVKRLTEMKVRCYVGLLCMRLGLWLAGVSQELAEAMPGGRG